MVNPRREVEWGIVIIAVTCACVFQLRAAHDLKSFNQSESYLADGQTLMLTQKLGEAVIQFDPAATQNTTPATFIAPDNTQYLLEVDLTPARGLYAIQTGSTITESANTAAISSVNTDTKVKYAYPVFAAPASGMRRFLNDEIDGLITIDLVPKSSVYWTASVNGIEILKP